MDYIETVIKEGKNSDGEDYKSLEYSFESGLIIQGRVYSKEPAHFYLDEMYYLENNSRKGYGRQALAELKDKYDTISVHEITDLAYRFWIKMHEEKLVTSLDSFREDC